MCGVVGWLRGDGEAALRAMSHRGIRASVSEEAIGGVVHVRLPIVGVDPEFDQPIEAGHMLFGFVGEVLNFSELEPLARCDAHVFAARYAGMGSASVRDYDGFWGYVVLDRRSGVLRGGTDYLSQKPMYYRRDEDAVAIASEPDALVAMGPVAPDRIYRAAVLKWGYCPEPSRTPYDRIRRLLPGEEIALSLLGGGRVASSSQIVDPVLPRSWDLRLEIEEAVRRRVLSSDVPVACLLSGGVDSALAYLLALRHRDVEAFHVENGEREWAEMAARRAGDLEPEGDAVDLAPRIRTASPWDAPLDVAVAWMQEPIDLGSLIPQCSLSAAVGQAGIRVALTGDGADELLGGYGRATHYDSQASDVGHELVCWHLPRLDRVMMRNKVEVRSPFLARRVVEACLALPWQQRRDKAWLRETFRDLLGGPLADQPKRPLRRNEDVVKSLDYRSRLVEAHERRIYGG